ncbi:MAG: hypothetical protein WCH61_06160, partial [bacterium]
TLDEWLAAAATVRPLILQTLFVQGAIDTTTPDELAALQTVYARLQPETVYLLTLDKPPADASILPVPRARMTAIWHQFIADATPGSPRFLLF